MKLNSLSRGYLSANEAASSIFAITPPNQLISNQLTTTSPNRGDSSRSVVFRNGRRANNGITRNITRIFSTIKSRGVAKLALPLLLCLLGSGIKASAQERAVVAVKTNLIYDALLSPNLGVEVGLSKKFTLDVSGNLNLWSVEGHTWKHWQVQPELRYWLCQRFAGHFFGLETHVGQFNVGNIDLGVKFLGTDFGKLKDHRYQGWQGGLGLTYGYAWIVSQHWNVEAELGIGYSYTKYDGYPCANCGTKTISGAHHNYFGITKANIGIAYIF